MSDALNAYFDKLETRCKKAESNLCVGLDPDPEQMPPKVGAGPEAIYQFCSEIIGATADYAAAFKPNLAFFESVGVEGWNVLAQVLEHVPKDIPVILDAKRGDIGSTAKHSARALFEALKADAVTINPLMGTDSVQPFLDYKDKGIYILCVTSNPGAEDFQMWFDLYLQIAKKVVEWNAAENCGLVVGATKPKYLANLKQETPNLPLLIPGVGAQGGEIELVLSGTRNKPRHKALVNVSRAILYASKGSDFGRAARKAAQNFRDKMNQARTA